jgi:hypothetical protein
LTLANDEAELTSRRVGFISSRTLNVVSILNLSIKLLDIESAILLLATYTNTSSPIKAGIIKIRKINMMLRLNLNSVFCII